MSKDDFQGFGAKPSIKIGDDVFDKQDKENATAQAEKIETSAPPEPQIETPEPSPTPAQLSEPKVTDDEFDFLNEFDETPAHFSKDTEIDNETGDVITASPEPENKPEEEPQKEAPPSREFIKERWAYWLKIRFAYQAKGMAWVAGNIDLEKEFGVNDFEFEMLVNAYAESDFGHKITKIPTWFVAIAVELIILRRQYSKAMAIKKAPPKPIAQKEIIKETSNAGGDVQSEESAKATPPTSSLPPEINGRKTDVKTPWLLNEKGYFKRKKNGDYLKQSKQKEKPDLTNEHVLALVSKHNNYGE